MTTPSRQDKFRGCLVGLALGDALGFPLEKQAPETCAPAIAGALGGDSLPSRDGHPFGQWSDDTQLACAVADACIGPAFWPELFAERLVTLHAEKRCIGWGRSTHEAVARLAEGTPWHEAGTPPPAAGNGAAMRVAPLALLDTSCATLKRQAHDQARVTHTAEAAVDAAVVVACAVRLSLLSDPRGFAPQDFLAALSFLCQPLGTEMTEALDVTRKLVDGKAGIVDLAALDPARDPAWTWISPYAVTTVAWSLACFLKHPDSYDDAVMEAVGGGGDVDTTAAITGALSGVRLGISALPPAHLDKLTDRGLEDVSTLIERADRLFRFHCMS